MMSGYRSIKPKKKNNMRCSWSITRITIHSELCELRNSRLQNMLIFTSRQAIVSDTHGIIRIRPLASSADDVMLTQLGSAHRTKPPHIGVNKIAWLPPYERREKKQPEDLQTMVGIYICTIWVHISPTSNSQSDTPHCTDVNISAFWSRWSDDRGGTSHNITVLMLR